MPALEQLEEQIAITISLKTIVHLQAAQALAIKKQQDE